MSEAGRVRRTRTRRAGMSVDSEAIVDRVLKFYSDDLHERSADREARLQRYAKFRQWVEPKDWPWEDASNVPLSDLSEKSHRVQDTLHNAVMSTRPAIGSKATNKADADKAETVDQLFDFQLFVEQDGETVVGDIAEAFVNDGVFTAYVPWVEEMREVSRVETFQPIPPDRDPEEFFRQILRQKFPDELNPEADGRAGGWDWKLSDGTRVRFFTDKDDNVEMVLQEEVEVYNGPRVIVKDYDDVYYPGRSANLQIPGPSNPGGAPHVILRDYPTIDEIKRLKKSKFYRIMTKEDVEKLDGATQNTADQEAKRQKDVMQGSNTDTPPKPQSHKRLTRLQCFDVMDVDGDGIDEDVIWWVIEETKTLVKAEILTEIWPSNPPRRPLAGSSFLQVKGRYAGISLLEMMEGLHDVMKEMIDQAVDSGTIRNVPFFFYRASGSMKPEVLRMMPGEGYPLADPKNDIEFPNFQQGDAAFSINMMTLLQNMLDRQTMIGETQLGRVPAGRSSALRTVGGIALLAGQGEARPERILRRFFMGIVEIAKQFHELNQHFLPPQKKILLYGHKPKDDPYREIPDRKAVSGRFLFDFDANVLNTSKAALQQSLTAFSEMLISEFAVQLGISDGDGIYRFIRDFGKSLGIDPDKYINEPRPGAGKPKLMAEEAIAIIFRDGIPEGEPEEGAIAHLQQLTAFEGIEEFGLMTEAQVQVYAGWRQEIMAKAEAEAQRQRLAQAAGARQQANGQGGPGRPAEGPPSTGANEAPLQNNELRDETLPGAGGGGAQ